MPLYGLSLTFVLALSDLRCSRFVLPLASVSAQPVLYKLINLGAPPTSISSDDPTSILEL
ncbi:hypothetical protein FA13DRAFT_1735680 [Coprinellus micaceus]|uniref:Uncharacterized protein n=1 Tax=Coprinellus micaceus TaxID=71717 RepID=A0A4Y7T297_COPMI|nr:hypothetical protein FA13DRAFT_1735680 [Coprinellus micaceus]